MVKIPTIKGDIGALQPIEVGEVEGLRPTVGASSTAATEKAAPSVGSPSAFRSAVEQVATAYRQGQIESPQAAVEQIVDRYVELKYGDKPLPTELRQHMKQLVSVQLSNDPLFLTLFKRTL